MINPLEHLDSLFAGLSILSVGGGGPPQWGRIMLEADLKANRPPTIVKADQVPDDATVISGGIMGSTKLLAGLDFQALTQRWDQRFELQIGLELMQKAIGKPVDYLIPFEMAGMNTPLILTMGARLGIPVIDGDATGRAVPETQMNSFVGHGFSLTPMPVVDDRGNAIVVFQGEAPTFPDLMGRHMITSASGWGANLHHPLSGSQLKQSLIPDTLSKAIALGEKTLQARRLNQDPLPVIAEALNGRHVHTGTIESIQEEEWQGFYFTRVALSGNARISIKNETMALFLDGKPAAIFPDLICILDPKTGRGLMNDELQPGQEVAVILAACHPRMRRAVNSEIGKTAFSPVRYGEPDLVYRPLEELLG